jgi:hypothetical protein
MSARGSIAIASLASGLALGVAGDFLLRASGAPGLNLFVWIALAGCTGLLLQRRDGGAVSGEARAAIGAGIMCAALLLWRDAAFLKVLAIGLTIAIFGLAAFRRGIAWIRTGGTGEYLTALAAGALHGAGGSLRAAAGVDWEAVRRPGSAPTGWRHAAAAARGIVLVIPFVVVFGALFVAADAVFAQMVADVIRIDLDTIASHVVLTGVLGWIAAGCLYGFVKGTAVPVPGALHARRPPLPVVEAGVALGVLNVLFLAFVLVQFRYLFGGTDIIEVTPGLTYSEYARRGFFELVFVAVLVLPTVLAADWLLRRDRPRDDVVFRVLVGMLMVLVFAIMASAVQRMRLYVDAYGLTEQRLYATSLLVFLALVFVWLAATVLRGRRSHFAFGSLLTASAVVLGLFILNPDALIARTNIDRARGADIAVPLDARYVMTLSADAAPVLLRALPDLPPALACPLAGRLLQRLGPDSPADLRTWSWSVAAARHAVGARASTLRALAPPGAC